MLDLRIFQESIQKFLSKAKDFEKEICISLLVLIFVYYVISITTRRKKYPPGPIGLPFVGYLPFLTKHMHLDFTRLGNKYGDVFSIKLGSADFVILHSAEAIKEAFSKPAFLGRPNGLVKYLSENSTFFAKDIHVWTEQRRFIVQSMKDLGLGKSKIENEIQDEINILLEVLKDSKGLPYDINHHLTTSMANNICALVFGKRYDSDDPIRKQLNKSLGGLVENVSQTSLANYFPWIFAIPFVRKFLSMDEASNSFKTILEICQQEIDNHKKTFDPRNIRDFIDSYLLEMKSRIEKNPDTSFSDDTLKANVADICNAGSETVHTSILWSMYTMAAYPEVQKKVQKEIFEVIGSERKPIYPDQKEMPYTHAVILEIQRWQTVVPLNVLRYTTSDTSVAGYNIPKGTVVQANLWAVHHDPNLWDEPNAFKPERFLNSDGTSVVKPSYFMPFSIGKRSCPGETMANMELFLYFTSILQKFDVILPEGVKPTFSGKLGLVYVKEPYKVRYVQKAV